MKSKTCIFLFFLAFFHNTCFSDGPEVVYLATFPRSGTQWVRHLVEEATHIATGCVYLEGDHLPTRLSWGGYSTEHGYDGTCRHPDKHEAVFVKTHYPYLPTPFLVNHTKTVCLIRHPIDSFYSLDVFFNQQAGMISKSFLARHIREWRKFYDFWEKQKNVIIIRYEDILQNPTENLSRIVREIGYHARDEDIQRAIHLYPPINSMLKHLDRYQKDDIDLIKRELMDMLIKYGYTL